MSNHTVIRFLVVLALAATGLHFIRNAEKIALAKSKFYKRLPWPLNLLAPKMMTEGGVAQFRVMGVVVLLVSLFVLIDTLARSCSFIHR